MEKDEAYYESLDKRTIEYKEYKKWKQSKGAGDTLEKITKATGIKKLVDKASEALGVDCGCDERKAKLNKLFPYKKVECLEPSEYQTLKAFFEVKQRVKITNQEQRELLTIYNRIFNTKKRISSCPPCIKTMVSELETTYLDY